MLRSSRFKSLVLLCMLGAAPAVAQDDPELGDTGEASRPGGSKKRARRPPSDKPPAEEAAVQAEPPPPARTTTRPNVRANWESASASEQEPPPGDSDHEAVVGRLGVGLLGLAEIPIGQDVTIPSDPVARSPLVAPVLGARYWLSPRYGVEAGIGFRFSGGSLEVEGDGDGDNSSTTAFAVHAGVPIGVMWGPHYTLIATPYLAFGVSGATDTRGTARDVDDVFAKGILLEAGAKGGIEVQLGSIGLRGLALQITGGLRLRYDSTNVNVPVSNGMGGTSGRDTRRTNVSFGTSSGATLGGALLGSLAAIYYF